jgi:hypothetical protein
VVRIGFERFVETVVESAGPSALLVKLDAARFAVCAPSFREFLRVRKCVLLAGRLKFPQEKERVERRDGPRFGCRRASTTEDKMTLRTVLFAVAVSTAVGFFAASAASAMPANGAAISQAAQATQAAEQVWWRYRWHYRWRR